LISDNVLCSEAILGRLEKPNYIWFRQAILVYLNLNLLRF
jgi:hypothetical protein